MSSDCDPFGRAIRRSARLSDEETARRMLETGVRMVDDHGLNLSSDLLQLEDVIKAADVSRSAVYRRWPTKAHYFADLLRELAGTAQSGANDRETARVAVQVALENVDQFRTAPGRKLAVVEMCRVGALQNFLEVAPTREWRTYVALQATLLGLPDHLDLQNDLTAGIRNSEQDLVSRMGALYSALFEVVGYRMRPLPSVGSDTMATLGAAVVRGLAINNITVPEVGEHRFDADPFDTGSVAEWSLPALGFASIILNLVEQDPAEQTWDDDRLAASRDRLIALREQFSSDTP